MPGDWIQVVCIRESATASAVLSESIVFRLHYARYALCIALCTIYAHYALS